ncbi:HAD-IA family hydrolase [Microbacterium laevaniformans]|uniref:HAD-IA family hydrolase n=1 Tax=Microbacterium laevaniformans TaxID=36807 RepID=UPI00363E56C5
MTSSPQSRRPLSSRPLARRAPEGLGIPEAAVLALAERLAAEGLDPHALLVARHGEVAFETAWAPYHLERPALVYSASKTYTALAIGFLADEGRLGLDDSAGLHVGEANPHGITVRHLLTMNTGHSAAQIERIGADPLVLLREAPAFAPSTHFAYNSPATHTLSAIVTALTGEPLTAYLRPRLLDPLGIGERWMSPYGGIEHGASGFHLTVDDLARTAIMLNDRGVVDGVQVAPARYVEEMSRPWSDTSVFEGPIAADGEVNDWSLGYGYQVWRGREGFRLDGAFGQFALVLPDHDLVIAYQGATLDTQATLRAFWAFVAAVEVADAAGGADAATPAATGADTAPTVPSAPTAALDAARDGWAERDRLTISPDPFDVAGLALDDAADGWRLALPGVGSLPVGPFWHEISVEGPAVDGAPDATHLRLATRGERRDDGSVLVHVVDTTSPHRAIVRRDASGAVHAGWHLPPLGGGWEALRVPASVPRIATSASAVLLDMDGTLVDSHAVVERLWTQWSLDHGVDPAQTLAIIHGRQGQDSMALLLPDRPHEVNLAENAAMLAAETAQTEGVVAIPGAADLLAALAHEGVPYALVTSATTELATARMRAAGLPMPPVVIAAGDVSRSKPDPEGFLAGAAALGVDAARCIVVEDSANGIAAGLAAGMRVIGVGPHAAAAAPTWTVADARGIHVTRPDGADPVITLD